MKVAVVKNAQNRTGSVFEDGIVSVYETKGQDWENVGTYENPIPSIKDEEDIELVADRFAEMLSNRGCQALVAKVSGVVFRSMEKHRIQMFPCSGIYKGLPAEFLDSAKSMLDEMLKQYQRDTQRPELLSLFFPCDDETNTYEINLIDAMNIYPELNTREIVFPFFEKVMFERLYMLCDHPPRWLKDVIPVLGYTYTAQQTENDSAFEVRIDSPMGMNEIKKALNYGGCSGC
ncbi:MAG: Fe-only nitrogenase accessory AnfO family protein [Ethanoligenens sp.]